MEVLLELPLEDLRHLLADRAALYRAIGDDGQALLRVPGDANINVQVEIKKGSARAPRGDMVPESALGNVRGHKRGR